MRDGRPALAALQDPSWQLRQLGLVRLRTLRLPARSVEALAPLAALDVEPPQADWPPLLAAAEFVDALDVAATQPPEISETDAVQTLVGMIAERLVEGRDPPGGRRVLLHALLAYVPLLPPPGRVFLCLSALAAVDEAQVLRDLRRPTLAAAVGERGQPALSWFARNDPYLYWHPQEARFHVDHDARRAGEPTATYRARTPWGPNEGPRRPPRAE